MQPQQQKPLTKTASFWGTLITIILIFLLSFTLNTEAVGALLVVTLGLAFLPILGASVALAIAFIVFGIIFTIYLTKRFGHIILQKQQINKPILYTSLVFGIVIALGFVVFLAIALPIYIN